MKIFTETERLILRELLPVDREGMYLMDSDPEVHTYLGEHIINTRIQAVNTINYVRRQYIENGIGRWAIINRKTNDFIGWAGLKVIKETINGYTNYYDLGYRLRRIYWGKGYATESAIACLAYGFENLRLPEIYAAAHVDNAASNRVLQKVGFLSGETVEYNGSIHNWYRIDLEAWKNRKDELGKNIS